MKPKILFFTQKIHEKDDDLAFTILWVDEMIRQGAEVRVICLEKGVFDDHFPVYSLGKESGAGKMRQFFNFYRYILTLDYDRVFVHMNPVYITLGGWYWYLRKVPMYLWYTHYTMHIHLWLSGVFCTRLFCATKQSLPQYEGNTKKVVTGHGIDLGYWMKQLAEVETNDIKAKKLSGKKLTNLLAVHRLCRSKRLDITIRALKLLPEEYTLTVYGRDVEKDYVLELHRLVDELGLSDRVTFMGPVPMADLIRIYGKFDVMVNMAGETIDKTMLEGMIFGLFPITTPDNSKAIGLPEWPISEKSEDLASFIHKESWSMYDRSFLTNIVEKSHSLSNLIKNVMVYIREGI